MLVIKISSRISFALVSTYQNKTIALVTRKKNDKLKLLLRQRKMAKKFWSPDRTPSKQVHSIVLIVDQALINLT